MKRLIGSTAVAAVFVLFGIASSANASSVSIATQLFSGQAPILLPILADSSKPTYTPIINGSVPDVNLSPYAFNSSPADQNAPYSVLSPGGDPAPSSATYGVSGAGSFTILWGSPDSYNTASFYTSTDGTTGFVGSFAGSDLACYIANTCRGTLWDEVTFSLSGIGSVVLGDDGTAAFEYGLAPINQAGTTPLPAAVWLFGSVVIAGAAGTSRMRRRRKVAA
jgi:hypothetical protein